MENRVDVVPTLRAQKRSNRTMGLTLGAIALVFFVGVFVRIAFFGS
jgi:hypothetical protein